MADTTNWVTGEACLWLDNEEHIYHESRRIVKSDRISMTSELKSLLRSAIPDITYGLHTEFHDIDWDEVITHIREDIEEGYE